MDQSMWYYQIQVQSIRAEIEYFSRMINILPFVFLILMGGILYLSQKEYAFRSWVVFAVILGATLPFVIARADFLMHRAAAYQRQIEEQIVNPGATVPGWETWKSRHQGTRAIWLLDLFASIAFLILFIYCNRQAVQYTARVWWRLPHKAFAFGAPAIFVAGCITIWYATVLARK